VRLFPQPHCLVPQLGDAGVRGVEPVAVLRVGGQLAAFVLRGLGHRVDERGRVVQAAVIEDVQRPEPAAEPDDLTAQGPDEGDVVRAGVTQHQRDGAAGRGADAQPAHQGALAETW